MSARLPVAERDEIEREEYRDEVFRWLMVGIVILVVLYVLDQVFAGETKLDQPTPTPAAYEHPAVER